MNRSSYPALGSLLVFGASLLQAKSKELKILATNKLDDGFDASPVVIGNELFLRGRANLYCIAE